MMLVTTIHHFWDRDASDKKKTVKKLKFPDPSQIYGCEYNINSDDLFNYLTFQLFSSEFPPSPPPSPKVAGHGQIRSKI